jgi:hypothetical protein
MSNKIVNNRHPASRPDTRPASSYDMNAAFMQLERHERGIYVLSEARRPESPVTEMR